jgi:hypothetical protein
MSKRRKLVTIRGVARITGYSLDRARTLAATGCFGPPDRRGRKHVWPRRWIVDYVRQFGRNPGRGRHRR